VDISLYSGDSRNLIINVVDENSNVINLTNATIEWILINQNSTILSKSVGEGITITNPTNGQFKIEIAITETKNLAGDYEHMARVITANGDSSIVFTGKITIQPSLI